MAQAQNAPTNAGEPAEATNVPGGERPFWRRPLAIVGATVLLAVAAFFGLRYLAESFTHESTDDAFIDSDVISLAPKVAGQIERVHVTANQAVKAGDLLLEIDPRDLQVQLEQKRAAVVAAQANVEVIKASLDLLRTQIATAEATAKQTAAEAAASEASTEKARADFKRAEELMHNHTISPQEFDSARAAATWAEANLKAQQEKAGSDQSKVAQARAQLETGRKGYERAEAQRDQTLLDLKEAELNLSYTRITAPAAGHVTRKSVEPGNYVQVGQSLMALVPEAIFVTANFKETQLEKIRPGQKVKLTIDSVAGGPFSGYVESIQAGSGAAFSLLPPENAVGNYVKVVQRVPVRIRFDQPVEAGHVLGPGMSVVPSVQVSSREFPDIDVAAVAVVVALGVGVVWGLMARTSKSEIRNPKSGTNPNLQG